jgi:hypothetical protein
MSPSSFTCEELDAINALASPLPPSVRDAFLQLITNRLAGYPEQARGVGLVYRIAAEVQRDFLRSGPITVGGILGAVAAAATGPAALSARNQKAAPALRKWARDR